MILLQEVLQELLWQTRQGLCACVCEERVDFLSASEGGGMDWRLGVKILGAGLSSREKDTEPRTAKAQDGGASAQASAR